MTIERQNLDDIQEPSIEFGLEPADLIETVEPSAEETHEAATVLISEAEVKLSTAAAVGLPRTKTPWWRTASRNVVAAARWAVREPEPKPHYPPRTRSYYETSLIDREMRRL